MSEMGEVLKVLENIRDKQDRSTERVHEKLDGIVEGQHQVETRLSLVEAKMPKQPCAEIGRLKEDVDGHLDKHDETRKFVKRGFIGGTIGILFLIAGTYITLKIKGVM